MKSCTDYVHNIIDCFLTCDQKLTICQAKIVQRTNGNLFINHINISVQEVAGANEEQNGGYYIGGECGATKEVKSLND